MEVITLGPPTKFEGTDPVDVMQWALEEGMSEVIVLGKTKDGSDYYAVSNPYVPGILYTLEKFKSYLLVEMERGNLG